MLLELFDELDAERGLANRNECVRLLSDHPRWRSRIAASLRCRRLHVVVERRTAPTTFRVGPRLEPPRELEGAAPADDERGRIDAARRGVRYALAHSAAMGDEFAHESQRRATAAGADMVRRVLEWLGNRELRLHEAALRGRRRRDDFESPVSFACCWRDSSAATSCLRKELGSPAVAKGASAWDGDRRSVAISLDTGEGSRVTCPCGKP